MKSLEKRKTTLNYMVKVKVKFTLITGHESPEGA